MTGEILYLTSFRVSQGFLPANTTQWKHMTVKFMAAVRRLLGPECGAKTRCTGSCAFRRRTQPQPEALSWTPSPTLSASVFPF